MTARQQVPNGRGPGPVNLPIVITPVLSRRLLLAAAEDLVVRLGDHTYENGGIRVELPGGPRRGRAPAGLTRRTQLSSNDAW